MFLFLGHCLHSQGRLRVCTTNSVSLLVAIWASLQPQPLLQGISSSQRNPPYSFLPGEKIDQDIKGVRKGTRQTKPPFRVTLSFAPCLQKGSAMVLDRGIAVNNTAAQG